MSLRIDNALASMPRGTAARKGGFLAKRDVDAASEDEATSIAIAETSADTRLAFLTLNQKDDPFRISVESVAVVEIPTAAKRVIGYAWFSEP